MGDVTPPSQRTPASAWVQAAPPPPPPPPGTAYAGVGIRFVAWLLDLLPLIVLGILVFAPLFGDFFAAMIRALPQQPGPGTTDLPELRAAMADALVRLTAGSLRAFAIVQVAALLYYAGSWLLLGRSPAMAMFGLRIVREEDGGRPNLGRVVVRYAGFLLSALPFLLGYAWALIDDRKQAWHDKLGGTLVVTDSPPSEASAPGSWGGPAQAASGPQQAANGVERHGGATTSPKRPSIGALAEWAWQTFRRAPVPILGGIGPILLPAVAVSLVALALYMVVAQDQQVAFFRMMRDAFAAATDPAAFEEYNRRVLAASAPSVRIGALLFAIGGLTGTLLVAACAVVAHDDGGILRPREVVRLLGQRLPALLVLGTAAALALAGEMLMLGLPSIVLADISPTSLAPGATSGALGQFWALLALTWLVIVPASLYLGAIWLLAAVVVAAEGLGVRAALARAWALSHGNMLWLMGILLVVGLSATWALGALATLPVGLLSEAYLAGDRLPVALQALVVLPITLVSAPATGLVYAAAYRALRGRAH